MSKIIFLPYEEIFPDVIVRCATDGNQFAFGSRGAYISTIWKDKKDRYQIYDFKKIDIDYDNKHDLYIFYPTLSEAKFELDKQLLELGFKLLDEKYKILL